MKVLIATSILIFVIAGCHSPAPVTLTRNRETNTQTISGLIPPGTSLAVAEKTMRANGFDWALHRNESTDIRKGNQIIGNTGPMTFALCTRHGDDTTWQAIIILNQEDQVDAVDVTSQARNWTAEPAVGGNGSPGAGSPSPQP